MTTRRIVLVACLAFVQPLSTAEKGAIARSADLVVVAQLDHAWCFPWFDGWHVKATLKVTKVLWGRAHAGDALDFLFVCKGCPAWPPPDIRQFEKVRGLWFAKKGPGARWESSGNHGGDPGYRPISDIEYFQDALSYRKAHGPW